MQELRASFEPEEARITRRSSRRGRWLPRANLNPTFLRFKEFRRFPDRDLAPRPLDALALGLPPRGVGLASVATPEREIPHGPSSGRFARPALYTPTLGGRQVVGNVVLEAAHSVVGATARGARIVAGSNEARGHIRRVNGKGP